MNDNSEVNWLLNWKTFAILSAAAALVSETMSPLKPARPLEAGVPLRWSPEKNTVPARLWQDPFQALEAARSGFGRMRQTTDLDLATTVLPEMMAHQSQAGSNGAIRVLLVMVSGGPYADDVESRLRSRHAVVSGLQAGGFVPEDASHIRLCRVSWPSRIGMIGTNTLTLEDWKSQTNGNLKRMEIPYEWFKPERLMEPAVVASNQAVLVLWLKDNAFADMPLYRLSLVLQALKGGEVATKSKDSTQCAILGPRTSTGLKAILDEMATAQFMNYSNAFEKVTMLSSWATAPPEFLLGTDKPSAIEKYFIEHNGPEFIRAVCPDNDLVTMLLDELQCRGVELGDANARIALFSEGDSFYGRALPASFEKELLRRHGAAHIGIRWHAYLNGLDGQVPAKAVEETEAAQEEQKATVENVASRVAPELAEGRQQLDYVRRLGSRIEATTDDGSLKAIGILGSDLYDKLLLLQDLRGRFPGVLFFTTDLDFRLLHPKQYPHTRNLIIASSYGLTTLPQLINAPPPFRDGYQTALFYATLRSLNTLDIHPQEWQRLQKAKIFEVGRSGAWQLDADLRETDYDVPSKCGSLKYSLVLLVLFSVITLLMTAPFGHALRRFFRRRNDDKEAKISGSAWWMSIEQRSCAAKQKVWFVFLALLVCGWMVAYLSQPYLFAEPLLFFEGVSVWPTELLRWAAAFLAVYFVVKASYDLDADLNKMVSEFPNCKLIKKEPIAFPHVKGCWLLPGLALIAIVAIVQRLSGKSCEQALVLMGLIVVCMIFKNIGARRRHWAYRKSISINYWEPFPNDEKKSENETVGVYGGGQETKSSENVTQSAKPAGGAPQGSDVSLSDADKFIKKYIWLSRPQNRIVRCLPLLLLFLLLGWLLVCLFGAPHRPYRGEISNWVDRLALGLSVTAFLFLLFYVMDVSRLCRKFLLELSRIKGVWPQKHLEQKSMERGMSEEHMKGWLAVKVAAQHTNVVNQIIYYPFVVLVLLMASRLRFFDNWDCPNSLVAILFLAMAYATVSSFLIRSAAEQIRRKAIFYLKQKLAYYTEMDTVIVEIPMSAGKSPMSMKGSAYASKLEIILQEVEDEKGGAFSPLIKEPAIGAFLLPPAWAGITTLIEKLSGWSG